MLRNSFKKLVVMGAPIAHSQSPRIFAELFRRYEIANACYYQLHADGSVPIRTLFKELSLFGANITSPLKNIAFASVDRASNTAKALGAVNTIVNRKGILEGFNTDPEGVQYALQNLYINPAGHRCYVLGAGGAAASVVYTLLQLKAHPIIINRTPDRAVALADRLGAQTAPLETASPTRGDLLFSCLPPGSALPPWDWSVFDWAFDSVYAASPLQGVEEQYKIPRLGSLEWLCGQGEAAFKIFFAEERNL